MQDSLKKVLLGSSTVLALGAVSPGVALAATANVTVRAAILGAININVDNGLNFGTVTSITAAGTVSVTSAGGVTPSAGISHAGGHVAASFDVTGDANRNVVATLPASISITETVGGVAKMSVTGFDINSSGAGAAATINLGAGGSVSNIGIGGVLNVGNPQTAGVYTGNMTLSVVYQ